MTHGQCNAKPAVTFLCHHRPSISTTSTYTAWWRSKCAWAACPGTHSTAQWVRLEPATSRSQVRRNTARLSGYHPLVETGGKIVFLVIYFFWFFSLSSVLFAIHLSAFVRAELLVELNKLMEKEKKLSTWWNEPRVPTQMTESKFRTFSGLLQHCKKNKKNPST